MWHLNFLIPFALAFLGLVALAGFLVKLLSDAIVDGTIKKDNETTVTAVEAGQSEASANAISGSSRQMPQALFAVEHKAL